MTENHTSAEQALNKDITEAKYNKLVADLEAANETIKDLKDRAATAKADYSTLAKLREQDQLELVGVKTETEFINNGGNKEYFKEYLKLIKGEEKVDFNKLKLMSPVMFNKASISIASPYNQVPDAKVDTRVGLSQEQASGTVFDPSKII